MVGSGQLGNPCVRMHLAAFSDATNCWCSSAWLGGVPNGTRRWQVLLAAWKVGEFESTPDMANPWNASTVPAGGGPGGSFFQ